VTPVLLALAVAAAAGAEPTASPSGSPSAVVQWRVTANEEVTGSPAGGDWSTGNQAAATGDVSWERGTAAKLGASLQASADDGSWSLRLREAYGRVSLGDGADVEAGKRLVRWGTGYGFAPTGVLDPPRDPSDPNDRLHRREGMLLARADVFRGSTAFTVAVAAPRLARSSPDDTPDTRLAARVRGTVSGFELAAIASAAPGEGPSYGGNVTHVVGARFEWHAEALFHDAASAWGRWVDGGPAHGRAWSAAAGFQYTLPVGANLVLEYHRDGRGLDGAQWARVLAVRAGTAPATSAPPAESPRRQHFLFARAAPVAAEGRFVPELIAIVGLDDQGIALVPALAWNASAHLQGYVRVVHLLGPSNSVNALAPAKTHVTAGVALRF
jgi:hypothetical protein